MFSPESADFSGIMATSAVNNIFAGNVFQKAFIEVSIKCLIFNFSDSVQEIDRKKFMFKNHAI